jgi:predicted amidohydrolase
MNLTAVVVQFPVSLSIRNNLEMIDSVLGQTNAGDWVIFPEGSLSGYSPDMSFLQHIDHGELLAGLRHVQQVAEQRMINVWVGACMNKDGKWFNTVHGFTADGKSHVYRKINLANQERGAFSVGDHLPTFDVDTPEGAVKIGIQICRELRFPEQWGWLARCGAQVILHLNNAVGEDRYQSVWKSHLISRAAETQRFVLSTNNAAPKQSSPTIAVAPDGLVMGEIVSTELDVLRVELDLSQASRKLLDQSRNDVVSIKANKTQNADE